MREWTTTNMSANTRGSAARASAIARLQYDGSVSVKHFNYDKQKRVNTELELLGVTAGFGHATVKKWQDHNRPNFLFKQNPAHLTGSKKWEKSWGVFSVQSCVLKLCNVHFENKSESHQNQNSISDSDSENKTKKWVRGGAFKVFRRQHEYKSWQKKSLISI